MMSLLGCYNSNVFVDSELSHRCHEEHRPVHVSLKNTCTSAVTILSIVAIISVMTGCHYQPDGCRECISKGGEGGY